MTDHQTQINNNLNNQASTTATNNTLPIKTTGNATRSVIHIVLCFSHNIWLFYSLFVFLTLLLVVTENERQRGGDKLKNCTTKFYEPFDGDDMGVCVL